MSTEAPPSARPQTSNLFLYFIAILLPPVAVLFKTSLGPNFWINILLTILGFIPGVIHAWYIISRNERIAGVGGPGYAPERKAKVEAQAEVEAVGEDEDDARLLGDPRRANTRNQYHPLGGAGARIPMGSAYPQTLGPRGTGMMPMPVPMHAPAHAGSMVHMAPYGAAHEMGQPFATSASGVGVRPMMSRPGGPRPMMGGPMHMAGPGAGLGRAGPLGANMGAGIGPGAAVGARPGQVMMQPQPMVARPMPIS